MQNADMQWESTTQLDVGLDVGFLNDRVRFIFDYYNKKTDNMLFSITHARHAAPIRAVKANVGSARFYGFEAGTERRGDPYQELLVERLGLTYSYNRNKVLSLPEEYAYDEVDMYGNPTGRKAYRIGGYKMSESGIPIRRHGRRRVAGAYLRLQDRRTSSRPQAEADAALLRRPVERPPPFGAARTAPIRNTRAARTPATTSGATVTVRRAMADGREQIIDAEDMFYLGNGRCPHSTGGISNTFRYKRLTLSIYLDYALGHSIYNYMKTRMIQNDDRAAATPAIASYVYDCWKLPGRHGCEIRPLFPPTIGDYGNRQLGPRTPNFNVEKADYLCLRDVTLDIRPAGTVG